MSSPSSWLFMEEIMCSACGGGGGREGGRGEGGGGREGEVATMLENHKHSATRSVHTVEYFETYSNTTHIDVKSKRNETHVLSL